LELHNIATSRGTDETCADVYVALGQRAHLRQISDKWGPDREKWVRYISRLFVM
jgi:hypothetical protein